MKKVALFVFIGLIYVSGNGFCNVDLETNTRTQPGYFKMMANDWKRGLTNIFTSPMEIPQTVKKYHEGNSTVAGLKEVSGFCDGLIRMVSRAGSGIWDLAMAFVPGDQEGGPVKPETIV